MVGDALDHLAQANAEAHMVSPKMTTGTKRDGCFVSGFERRSQSTAHLQATSVRIPAGTDAVGERIPLETVGTLVKVPCGKCGKMLVGPADESKHARDKVAVESGHPRRDIVRQQQRCDEDDGDQGWRKALDAASVEGDEEGG
eukprot:7390267-Prymnesium_polylepis.1